MIRNAGAACLGLALLTTATGCKSAFIGATVTNATGAPISEVEIDYPSASFGTNALDAGKSYHYRFEIIGEGPMKASWTDAARKPHAVTGPSVTEGQRGTLSITLNPDGTASWQPKLNR